MARRRDDIFGALTPAQKIQVARHPQRPSTLDYIQLITDEWYELHGDRRGSDDQALIGGVGRIGEQAVVLIGHQKGRDTKENVARNFGMASPGGYRKALRLMEHADRFRLPILSFIDTPGAYAGVLAEEQGQGEAIAVNLREMFRLRVPIIATVIGEGGSGGALGIGVADRLLMFEHSVYTVASPEACASILWRDAAKAPVAAAALKITAPDLLKLGVIDAVIREPSGGNHWAPLEAACALKQGLLQHLAELQELSQSRLLEERYDKFRRMGRYLESGGTAVDDIAAGDQTVTEQTSGEPAIDDWAPHDSRPDEPAGVPSTGGTVARTNATGADASPDGSSSQGETNPGVVEPNRIELTSTDVGLSDGGATDFGRTHGDTTDSPIRS